MSPSPPQWGRVGENQFEGGPANTTYYISKKTK